MKTYTAAILGLIFMVPLSDRAMAECAWVLWEERAMDTLPASGGKAVFSRDWMLHDAYEEKDHCEKTKYAAWQHELDKWIRLEETARKTGLEAVDKIEGVAVRLFWRYKDGASNTLITYYRCLPDTVDPRDKH